MENLVYYVYEIIDPRNNKIIYVGKGKNNRYLTHEKIARYCKKPINNKLNNKLKKIIELNLKPIYVFIAKNISEYDAYKIENEITINIGLDKLCNLKHGGTNGAKFSEETRNKMKKSAALKDKSCYSNSERNKKISIAKLGVPRTEKTKQKIRKFMKEHIKGKTHIEIYGEKKATEIKEKIILKSTGKKRSENFKLEQSLRFSGENNPMFGKKQSDEFKETQRERFLKNNPGKNKSDETKLKISESKKGVPSKNKGIPLKKIKCPYCDKMGAKGQMNRWHFENCKNKK